MIRVVLPQHLRILGQISGEAKLDLDGPVTLRQVVDELEYRYPMLRGTIRDHGSDKRRPMIRFFACEQDFSNDGLDVRLPDAVASGAEPLLVVGAIAGG
jgi:sulfur-carrier protein